MSAKPKPLSDCKGCQLGTCTKSTHGADLCAELDVGAIATPRLSDDDTDSALNVLRSAMQATTRGGRPLWHIQIKAAEAVLDRQLPRVTKADVRVTQAVDDGTARIVREFIEEQRQPQLIAELVTEDE